MAKDRAEDAKSLAFFRDTEAIKKLLGDPMTEIVETPEELKMET